MHYKQPASWPLSLASVSMSCVLGMNLETISFERIPPVAINRVANHLSLQPGSGDLSAMANTMDNAVNKWLKQECREITALVANDKFFIPETMKVATSGVR